MQFPNHPTLFMSHKAEGPEYIFSFFSVKSQIEGFSPVSLNLQSEEQEERGGRGREEGEVGRSIIARSERNLCV